MHGRRARLAAAALAVALLVSSCGGPGKAEVDRAREELRDRLEGIAAESMAESEAPGALAGVWEEGEEACLVSLGYADTASSRPLQPGDRFRIGDLTWTFTATVVLQLVDEGRLGLDDPLLAHFPQARQVAGITVRQVLDHTSGLFDYTEDGGFQGLLLADPGRRWSPEELVGISFMHDPYFPPGTGWRYSRTNCIIAGLLVERCTAGRLEEEIDRRIVSRLGLLNTYFPSSSNIPGMYCRGYELREAGQRSDVTFERNTSWVWASGGMISNLEDLATFFGALAGGGLVGGGAWREAQKRVAAPLLGAGFEYGPGLAWWDGCLGHFGMLPGYQCAVFSDPADGRTVAFMLNATEAGGAMSPAENLALRACMKMREEP